MGQDAPLQKLPGATATAGEVPSDGDTHDPGDMAVPAGVKLRE